jgi:hypothetical protein
MRFAVGAKVDHFPLPATDFFGLFALHQLGASADLGTSRLPDWLAVKMLQKAAVAFVLAGRAFVTANLALARNAKIFAFAAVSDFGDLLHFWNASADFAALAAAAAFTAALGRGATGQQSDDAHSQPSHCKFHDRIHPFRYESRDSVSKR